MTTNKVNPQYSPWFRLDEPACKCTIDSRPAAAVAITKGQALHDDGSGFVTNTVTAFAATFVGIAVEDCDNSAGAAGDLQVLVYLPSTQARFWVPNVVAGTVAARTDVGEICDLETAKGIDVTDNTVVAWGFYVDDIDISTKALAANSGGFCLGRLLPQPQ